VLPPFRFPPSPAIHLISHLTVVSFLSSHFFFITQTSYFLPLLPPSVPLSPYHPSAGSY
jgi:hypothetical protein